MTAICPATGAACCCRGHTCLDPRAPHVTCGNGRRTRWQVWLVVIGVCAVLAGFSVAAQPPQSAPGTPAVRQRIAAFATVDAAYTAMVTPGPTPTTEQRSAHVQETLAGAGVAVLVLLGLVIFVWLLLRGLWLRLFGPPKPATPSGWATPRELRGALTSHPERAPGAVLLAMAADGRYLCAVPQGDRPAPNIVLFGPPGVGKSSTMRAALLAHTGAAVVVDVVRPDADFYSATAGHRATQGPIAVLDLTGGPSQRYDPLRALSGASWAESAAATLLDTEAASGDAAPYTRRAAAMLVAVLRAAELADVPRLRFAAEVFSQPSLSAGAQLVEDVSPALAAKMAGGKRASAFTEGAYGTAADMLAPIFNPAILDVLSGSDVDPAALRAQHGTLYIRVREDELDAVRGAVALLLSSILRSMAAAPDRTPVLVVADEVATVRPPDLPDLSAWCGSRGMTLLCAAQSVADLEDHYGQRGAHALLAHMGARVSFRPADPVSAFELERALGRVPDYAHRLSATDGRVSVGWSQTERPLLTAAQAMGGDVRQVYVSLPGLPRIVAWRVSPADLPDAQRFRRPAPLVPVTLVPERLALPAGEVPERPPTARSTTLRVSAGDRQRPAGPISANLEERGPECGPYPPDPLDGLPAEVLARITRADGGCWLWGGPTNKGYPVYGHAKTGVHVLVFEHCYRKLGPGEEVDHIMQPDGECTSTLCVRPEHLQALSAGDHRRATARRKRWRLDQWRERINDALGEGEP